MNNQQIGLVHTGISRTDIIIARMLDIATMFPFIDGSLWHSIPYEYKGVTFSHANGDEKHATSINADQVMMRSRNYRRDVFGVVNFSLLFEKIITD